MKLFSKGIVISVLVLLVVFLGKDIVLQAEKFGQIDSVEKKASDLQKQNSDLKKVAGQASSAFEMEKMARDQLGYQKKGETLYVTNLPDEKEKNAKKQKSNWLSWIELFFN